MRKLILLLALLSFSAGAYAGKKTPADKAKEKTDQMQKDLQLTADQYKKIYDLNLKMYTSVEEYDAKKPSKKFKKKQKQIVQDLRDDQFKKIMNTAQYKKYHELKKQAKDEEKQLMKSESTKLK